MAIRFLMTILFASLLSGCPPPRGVFHEVGEGQTLYRISKAYDVDEVYLARINGISDPARLRSGTRLFIPGAHRGLDLSAGDRRKKKTPKAKRAGASAKKQVPGPRPVPVKAAPSPKRAAPAAPSVVKKFIWPLKGEVVGEFGKKGEGLSRGLEIAARKGTPVVSSAAGKVTYSGDAIRGYGNLIILAHDDTFYTVYGFNEKNLVEMGDFVSKGQKIALTGSSPGGAGRLHFEIRHGKNAVNPIFYLPKP